MPTNLPYFKGPFAVLNIRVNVGSLITEITDIRSVIFAMECVVFVELYVWFLNFFFSRFGVGTSYHQVLIIP